jgi:hypothetical protein
MHSEHLNFSKTLLKNMNSYLHTSSLTDEWFKKLVEILPLSTEQHDDGNIRDLLWPF